MAQPALGFQVRKLEDELGSPLLIRHSRGVEPTEAGLALVKHAHAILRQIELARQEVIDLAGPPRGPLAIGITPTASALLATGIVKLCSASYPGIALNLVEGLSEEVMKWLDEGRVDLGFTYNPEAVRGVETEALLIEDLFFITPIGNGEAEAERIAFARLERHAMILPSRPHGTRMLIEQAAGQRGIALNLLCEVDSVATVRELVEAGVGCTVLPFGAVHDAVEAGRLRAIRIDRPRISRTLHIAQRSRAAPSNAGQAVRDVIKRIAGQAVRDVIKRIAEERTHSGGGYWREP